jgi:predicted ferric reductase
MGTPEAAPNAGRTLISSVRAGCAGLLLALAVLTGMAAGGLALGAWLPGLTASMSGADAKVFWYLSRSSAFAAYGLLWLSMILGLLLTNRMARLWPGGPAAYDLHQYASWLGLAMSLFHALILLGDGFLRYDLGQILVPFGSTPYRLVWVGLGQVTLYGLGLVTWSFYAKRWLGPLGWRIVHALSFGLFILALLHGVLSGTDSAVLAVQRFYWATGASVLFLALYRVLLSRTPGHGASASRRSPRRAAA